MPAIRTHSTATSDAAWDAAQQEKNAKSGETGSYYANIYAWRDSDGEEGSKSTYKFPHHFVAASGTPAQTGVGTRRTTRNRAET